MAKTKRLMHLMGFNIYCPAQHSYAAWRHPLNTPPGHEWNRAAVWQQMARELERGRFDGIFFADHLAPLMTYQGKADGSLRNGVMFPVHDPLMLLPMLAAVTSRLGLTATLSATYYPAHLAVRKLATLDHLSEGRAGWNIVTSFAEAEANAMGTEPIPHDERYQRANEYMEICHKLWDSWGPEAYVRDVEGNVLVDPSEVHPYEYAGKYLRSSGFAVNAPSPQRHPVLFQAGSSPAGREFCARWAEASFSVLMDAPQMKSFVDDLGARAQKYGRPPDAVKCLFGLQPIVGRTEAEAREKQQYMRELSTVEAGMTAMSSHTCFDFSTLDPDTPLSKINLTMPGIAGLFNALREATRRDGKELTIGEACRFYGESTMLKQVVGTGAQVAEQMIAMWEESGAHGFVTTPIYYPGAYTEFVDLVVPELQKRGVYRREYSGRTLREHLAQTESC